MLYRVLLFTNVPISETVNIIKDKLDNGELGELVAKFCEYRLKSTYVPT